MAIDPVTGVTIPETGNALSRSTLANNFDTFLTLLTAQLQNQDPLAPMDSNEFTQQLVQFSQVEQQIATNEQLEQMLVQSRAAASGTALSYLGRDAILATNRTYLSDEAANWSYSLPEGAASLKIEVRDMSGRTVYTSTTEDRGAGSHLFTWDGRNNSGVAQDDGVYQLVVTAKDNDGATINAGISTRELILGIDLASENPMVLTPSGTHELSIIRAILDG